ncbi:MAG: aromatic amino acid ammonia-lyase [Lentisphaeraceae bacterium]|nr:aromatic amino acid ammonia-lyase [Lentisphaeraceae bacterium]
MKVDFEHWNIEEFVKTSLNSDQKVSLGEEAWQSEIQKGADFLKKYWENKGTVYGVTTGYGDSCTVSIPTELIEELPTHLTRFHGCGMGDYFNEEETRAILLSRLSSLKQGHSGVRLELVQGLVDLLNNNILPLIPKEGSVGASGDLTPLSYVAAALIGEREVYFDDDIISASEALAKCGLKPLSLQPKEGLALMNGTAVMTALACLAWKRADYLCRLASRTTSLLIEAVHGNRQHFSADLFTVKPHKGQNKVADWIYNDLLDHSMNPDHRLQDRYSVRCAPHVIGVLKDALPWMKEQIETELNSANDNPIIDYKNEQILHGGHFYGGHIAFVMDSMKNAVANIADLQDRQMALMMDKNANNGLPANLSGSTGERAAINHGFKAVQIAVSAWTAEALKLTMPASVFSRSTECHNQDKVSMGTIAARDCLRVLELCEQVAAATLLASVQGIELRKQNKQLSDSELSDELNETIAKVREISAFVDEDRPLELELREMVDFIRKEHWSLYESDC